MKQECPDRQWLSVYFDNEMDSPWKEKMERHIAGCGCCARRLEEYKQISLSLAPPCNESIGEAQSRVLQKLETGRLYSGYGSRPAWGPPIWKRRISIPVPAAAAVFMLIALAFLWIIRSPEKTGASNIAITAKTEIIPDILPVSNMESVLQYLGSTDTGDIIILKLPESRNFASYGEPAIIRAADYPRNTPRDTQGRRK